MVKFYIYIVFIYIGLVLVSCKQEPKKAMSNTEKMAAVADDFNSQFAAGMEAITNFRGVEKTDSMKAKQALDAAVYHFEKANLMDSMNLDLVFLLGNSYYLSKSYYRAMSTYERIKRVWPNEEKVNKNLRLSYREVARAELYNENNPLSCRNYVEKSLKMDPTDVQSVEILGVSLARLSNWDTAVIELKRAIQMNPKSATALTNLSIVMSKQEKWEESKKYIEMAKAIDPRMENPMLTEKK